MEELICFLGVYGWQLGLIAFIGIVILGALKYANAFSKVEKENRKPIYFGISIGFSFIATIIYLLCINQFEMNYLITITTAVYALNQTMYAIYETTKLKDLMAKILKYVKQLIKTK